ncbi:integrase catalytic domain-containing protein [Trichonephila inaurata madagascariensis]|uniref:Integrase catalytic domain-containing protein n=1 Tax=Trichonephila inaurata madagascariensis TaxID=2747483 RepID=A0A8X6WVS7_9ARAC|nr:integrase catalytic domain-containing protein [Trichonephila inaurata madagascariensis]
MTAYVLRYCNNIKRNSPELVNSLSSEEIEKAEETLIKIMQSKLPSEIREKYKDTVQFFEEIGILKIQIRLILSQDPEDFTHPTVLPDHPLLERLVLYTHRSLSHAGVLTTLAQLIEKFWIPKGRRAVRAILRQCIKCNRLTGGKVNSDPAPLPPVRIHTVAAFQITGADLAEKFDLKINKNVCVSLAERDNRRIFTSRKKSLASSFEARRAKKIKKTKKIELFKQQESISYDPGAF